MTAGLWEKASMAALRCSMLWLPCSFTQRMPHCCSLRGGRGTECLNQNGWHGASECGDCAQNKVSCEGRRAWQLC